MKITNTLLTLVVILLGVISWLLIPPPPEPVTYEYKCVALPQYSPDIKKQDEINLMLSHEWDKKWEYVGTLSEDDSCVYVLVKYPHK